MPVECPGSIWPDANLTLFIKCPAELTVELDKISYQGCWLHDPYCVAGKTTAYGGQLLKLLPLYPTITANMVLSLKFSGISIFRYFNNCSTLAHKALSMHTTIEACCPSNKYATSGHASSFQLVKQV